MISDKIGYFINVTIRPHLPVPESGKRIIACVGDSLTYGAGVRLTRSRDSYPAQLERMLGHKWQVLNYGLSWRTLQDSGDLPYRNEAFYEKSRSCGAEIYVIMLGSNDAKPFNWNKENYRRDLGTFVRSYLDLPQKPRIILMQPTCAFPNRRGHYPYKIDSEVVGGSIHEIVWEIGKEAGCPVLDLYSLTAGHPEWFPDGAHPNRIGNKEIARVVRNAICNIEA